MTPQPPTLYAGLDQMIAKPTRKEETGASERPTPQEPEREKANAATENIGPTTARVLAAQPSTDMRMIRRLDPEPPDSPALYRKQTLQFGPIDLEAVQRLQAAVAARGHQVGKSDLVRAAVEFLAKDLEAYEGESYLVRKFVRR